MNRIEEVREFIVNHYLFGDGTSLADDTPLLEEGIIDSTGFMELTLFLEKTYHITIEGKELTPANLDSLVNIHRFLNLKLSGQSDGEAARPD